MLYRRALGWAGMGWDGMDENMTAYGVGLGGMALYICFFLDFFLSFSLFESSYLWLWIHFSSSIQLLGWTFLA